MRKGNVHTFTDGCASLFIFLPRLVTHSAAYYALVPLSSAVGACLWLFVLCQVSKCRDQKGYANHPNGIALEAS